MEWISEHWVEIVAGAGLLIALARIIVMWTPTKKDNAALEKFVAFLKTIGLHVKD